MKHCSALSAIFIPFAILINASAWAVDCIPDDTILTSQADVEEFQKIQLIQPYLNTRAEQINTYNTENNINKDLAINGRNLTNIGVFRKYVNDYLQNHSAVNKGMTLMVRQLNSTEHGVPLELYCFTKTKDWAPYEVVSADIFDHIYAIIEVFGLRLFESPTGNDFKQLGN